MNLKTTIALVLLAAAGTGAWVGWEYSRPTETSASKTVDYLQTLKTGQVTHIEVARGSKTRFILDRPKNSPDWSMPGNWPVRQQEAQAWLGVLTSVQSRFSPIAVIPGETDLAPFGLVNPLVVKVTIGDTSHTLRIGEEPAPANPSMRVAYVRLDDENEILRLGPGVFADLNRDPDFFRQKRLFPIEQASADDDPKEKFKQLAAKEATVQTKETKFRVARKNKQWTLQSAHTKADKDKDEEKNWKPLCSEDRLDPARRTAFLRSFAELWVESFVEGMTLKDCGLEEPEFVVSIIKNDGSPMTLRVGKVSRTETRQEPRPSAPGMPKMGPETVEVDFRYAKLEKNDQIFEINAGKLADITAKLDKLRDPLVARFQVDDVKRFELSDAKQQVVLVKIKEGEPGKEKEKWQVEKPAKEDADTSLVEKALNKLARLDVKIDDKLDAKAVGLDASAATIRITVEEDDKDAKKVDGKYPKKNREIVLRIGKKADEPDKVYVRNEAWPRIDQVDGDVGKISRGGHLEYRSRELWKIDREVITRITIQANPPFGNKDATPYHLDYTDKGWKLSGPLDADISAKDVEGLVDDLASLRCDKFEAANVKDLDKYGIDNKNFKLLFKITVAAKNTKPRVLEIGNQVHLKEGGRFARIDQDNTVFILNEKFVEKLRKDPSDFLDKDLWKLNPAQIQRVHYDGAAKFALEQKMGAWSVIDAPVPPFPAGDDALRKAVGPLLQLRAEKYEAFGGKIDFAAFGLLKPDATITITLAGAEGAKATERILEIGKETAGGRFVRIDKKDAVAVLDAEIGALAKVTYLDFADTRVLKFDGDSVMMIDRKMTGGDLELTRRDDNWLITKPGTRDADLLTIIDLLRKTSQLQAKRIAALSTKDLATYGLDKPTATVTLHVEIDGNVTKHVIKVGNPAAKDGAERFALIDNRPMVAVLSAELSRHLVAPVLYFADRNLASFSTIDRAELTAGQRKAAFTKSDSAWKMTEPIAAGADSSAIEEIIRNLQRLRADEIIAEKATDLKKYGLDAPIVQWRLKLGDNEHLNLLVGAAENDKPDARRYAKLTDKAAIFVLSPKLVQNLQRECRDRNPWPASFSAASATKLTVATSDKMFTITRKDKKFESADGKVKDQAALDLLIVLEAMRVTRYVADAKSDMKKYGLEAPAWKIEAEGPKDKRAIWLGGYEDKSKRMYATVPGSGAVFVIDDSDAFILARPRETYVETEKKK